MVNISWFICPNKSPCATIINENSEIWASDIDVKKAVLFLYPKNAVVKIIIKGLTIITSNSKTTNGLRISLNVPNSSSIPKETKNITEKKSLKGLILPMISIL